MAKINKDHHDKFFSNNINYETRTLMIGSSVEPGEEPEIDASASGDFIKGFHILQTQNQNPITVILNSLGGYVSHAFAIYDIIRSSPCRVTIKCAGQCMSAATIILQAADERLAYPNCWFMLHDGQDGFSGKPKDLERWAEAGKKIRLKMYQVYAERTDTKSAYWNHKLSHDWIMSAEEALKEKLIDGIIPYAR